jgi:hypothetical protein
MTKPDLETLAGNLARASVYTGDDIGLPLKEHGAPSGSGSYGSQFVMVSVKMRDEIIAALRSYSPASKPAKDAIPMTTTTPEWLSGLDHRDWLFDGHPINKNFMDAWNDLDWSKAWMDMGPSVAGNPGPYWHVPRIKEDTTHRLYPKVLQGKWLRLIQHAIAETAARKSPVQAAPRALLSEETIAALIREHVEVGYTLGEGGLVDPDTIFVNAAGAAHVIHHAVTSGQRDPNSMDELERQGYFDDAGGHD